jgi:Na+-transporting methylmalonyl-CoA/oxaloacetate decarboxylase gamma subunit
MQPAPVDWGQAFRIVGGGILVVFLIMSLLALATTIMGKIFTAREARKKAAAQAKEAEA